jgi:predicted permease
LLAESLTLAVIAGALGLLIARSILQLIVAVQPGGVARIDEVALDPRALAASFAFCLLTAALVGLAPALTLGRRATGPASAGFRRALVAAEFAMAIVLLAGAGLFLRSLWNLQGLDPGFRADRILMLAVSAPQTGFYEPALARIGGLPGVESVAIVSNMFTRTSSEAQVAAEGAPPVPIQMRSDEISDGFFRTVGTPLLRGRFFVPGDGVKPPKVAIVNDILARRLWPNQDPVGRRFRIGGSPWFTVVGVVRDMRRQGLEFEPIAQMFEPLAQNSSRRFALLVRTAADNPLSLAPAVEAAIHEVAANAFAYGINTVERELAEHLAPRRLQTTLVAAFSLMALLIAAIGIYGLVQYSVTARTREIGIRIAIGARAETIFGLILREGMTLGLSGLVVGLIAALVLNRFASTLLFGVSASDPLTFLAVSGILLAVAAIACYFPARRAMKLDPVRALRFE